MAPPSSPCRHRRPHPARRAGRTGLSRRRTARLPWHGGHGRKEGAARCRSRATWASGQAGHPERRCLPPPPWRANVPLVGGEAQRGWRRRLWGGWSSQASTRPRDRGESDGQARGRGPVALRLARAPTTCRRRAWDGQRVAPVVPPAGAEVVPAGTTTGERGTGVPLGSDRPVRRVLPDSGARRGRLPHARRRVAHGWHRGGCRGRNSRLPLPSREQPFKTTRPTSSPAAARPDLGLGRPAGDPSGRPRAP